MVTQHPWSHPTALLVVPTSYITRYSWSEGTFKQPKTIKKLIKKGPRTNKQLLSQHIHSKRQTQTEKSTHALMHTRMHVLPHAALVWMVDL